MKDKYRSQCGPLRGLIRHHSWEEWRKRKGLVDEDTEVPENGIPSQFSGFSS
jgi:hypothetical protein